MGKNHSKENDKKNTPIFEEHDKNNAPKIEEHNENKVPKIDTSVFDIQKGLKKNMFIKIFSYLSAKDTANCSLVCKEWNEISKIDSIWEKHYQRDFVDIMKIKSQENYEFLKPHEFQFSDDMYVVHFLRNYKPNPNSPFYMEYKFVVAKLKELEKECIEFDRNAKCEMRCDLREDLLDEKDEIDVFFEMINK